MAKKAKKGLSGLKSNKGTTTYLTLDLESDTYNKDRVEVYHPANASADREWEGKVVHVAPDPDDAAILVGTVRLKCKKSPERADDDPAKKGGPGSRGPELCRVLIGDMNPTESKITIDLYNG